MFERSPRLAAPLALLLVAACAAGPGPGANSGGTTVYSSFIETRYSPLEVHSIGPAMPLEVHGRPPDGSDPEAVAAAMILPAMYGSKPMTLVPPGTRGRRLVLAFNPTTRLHLCKKAGGGDVSVREGVMEAAIAFCLDEFEMTSASIRSGATAGPSDGAFTGAMLYALRVILPPGNPLVDRGRRPWLFGY